MILGKAPHTRRFTDSEIATITGVSHDAAYRWRSGQRKIPTGYKRMLGWIAGGRLLPASWRGWRFENDELISPLNDRFTAITIEQFRMALNANEILTVANRQLHEYIDYLESVTPKASVTVLDRSKMRPSATAGYELNRLFRRC